MTYRIVPSREDLFKRALSLYKHAETAMETARMQLAGVVQNPGEVVSETDFMDAYIGAVETVRTAVAYDMSEAHTLFREIKLVLGTSPIASLPVL